MVDVYHRTDLAREMARQLLEPKVLDLPLRSGLFLSGLRRTGKTTFLRQDLIPALETGEWGLGEDGRRRGHLRGSLVQALRLSNNRMK